MILAVAEGVPPNQTLHSDRGRILVSRDTTPLQRPRRVNYCVRQQRRYFTRRGFPIMSTRLAWVAVLLLTVGAGSSSAQPPAPAAQREAMKKLDFLVGQWKGEGWMEFAPGQRRTFKGTEVVQSKLDGLLLAVEGLHRGQVGATGEEAVVHHAFALVSYDGQAKRYRFQAFTN